MAFLSEKFLFHWEYSPEVCAWHLVQPGIWFSLAFGSAWHLFYRSRQYIYREIINMT
ncbi:hypothetical protein BABINDRAFT_99358 [Babjeviella inositovora NRRL Y-12698]|uniref:Uncharacterized protein n=1 Tax=Babjeviella inositovora NRRL Y-12698 TaxID=984486 RepID=A0A1E3QII4_9ASCO|nr:uncharacterized protein BABINDRAFT_99358 [Babjeviella inositovora NRRL Y-12698]ODQ77523.1 hypothetical protein BABINDRAFT_99358 [Babjeviella inositovora NRRL Y-12698]